MNTSPKLKPPVEGTEMTARRQTGGIKVEWSSGNVYADVGLKDADALLIKSGLVVELMRIIREKALTQTQAAEIVGLPQPKLSKIMSGQFHGVSERRLIDCLTRLGRDVEIVVKEKPRSRATGRLSVVVQQRNAS